MRIAVIGDVLGKANLINGYIEKSQADIVICTGDIGLYAKNKSINPYTPHYFDVKHEFFQYLIGKKKFIKPVISTYGPHDNFQGIRDLLDGSQTVYNFTLLKNGEPIRIPNNTQDTLPLKEIVIGGIGGVYSPKSYESEGEYLRHFRKKDIESLKQHRLNILVAHDLIGSCSKKQIIFSDETYDLLDATMPFYCIVGRYRWFGSVKLPNTRVVVMPKAQDGYLLIDTKDWDAETYFNNEESNAARP
jgi:hypothetical protein